MDRITIGYGDITPVTPKEMMLCIFLMLLSSGVFGYNLNTINHIFQDLFKQAERINQNFIVLNNYMQKKKISNELKSQIREYLDYIWRESNNDIDAENQIINQLSDVLKDKLLVEANKIVLIDSPIFKKNFSETLISKTVPLIKEQKYTPGEIIFLENDRDDCSIYFIERGSFEIFIINQNQNTNKYQIIQTLKQNESFGEENFFTGLPRSFNIRSVEYSTILQIKRQDFLDLLNGFQDDYEKFCYIKDNLLFSSNYNKIQKCCITCLSQEHTVNTCPIIHFNADKQSLINQYNAEYNQERFFQKRFVVKKYQSILENNELILKTDKFHSVNSDLLDKYEQKYELDLDYDDDNFEQREVQNNEDDVEEIPKTEEQIQSTVPIETVKQDSTQKLKSSNVNSGNIIGSNLQQINENNVRDKQNSLDFLFQIPENDSQRFENSSPSSQKTIKSQELQKMSSRKICLPPIVQDFTTINDQHLNQIICTTSTSIKQIQQIQDNNYPMQTNLPIFSQQLGDSVTSKQQIEQQCDNKHNAKNDPIYFNIFNQLQQHQQNPLKDNQMSSMRSIKFADKNSDLSQSQSMKMKKQIKRQVKRKSTNLKSFQFIKGSAYYQDYPIQQISPEKIDQPSPTVSFKQLAHQNSIMKQSQMKLMKQSQIWHEDKHLFQEIPQHRLMTYIGINNNSPPQQGQDQSMKQSQQLQLRYQRITNQSDFFSSDPYFGLDLMKNYVTYFPHNNIDIVLQELKKSIQKIKNHKRTTKIPKSKSTRVKNLKKRSLEKESFSNQNNSLQQVINASKERKSDSLSQYNNSEIQFIKENNIQQ